MAARLRLQELDKSKSYCPFRCAPWCFRLSLAQRSRLNGAPFHGTPIAAEVFTHEEYKQKKANPAKDRELLASAVAGKSKAFSLPSLTTVVEAEDTPEVRLLPGALNGVPLNDAASKNTPLYIAHH